jgi:hypothetical protein
MRKRVGWSVALALFASVSGFAESFGGRYFVVLFGYEGPGNKAVDSHTFAAFLDGDQLERGYRGAPPTISWLPEDGIVRPFGVHRGRNFTLEETLALADDRGYRVTPFGPFEIPRHVYQAAMAQIHFLESGRELYKMVAGAAARRGLNCIHAVSNVVGPLRTGVAWGVPATEAVTQHFGRVAVRFPRTYPAIFEEVRELRYRFR